MNIRRLVLAALFATALAGGGYAFAASANVTSNDVMAGTAVTSSCQTSAMTTSYPASGLSYDATAGVYEVDTVDLSGVVGCAGQSAKLQLTGTGGTSLGESTLTLAAGTNSFTFATPVSAGAITGIALVVA